MLGGSHWERIGKDQKATNRVALNQDSLNHNPEALSVKGDRKEEIRHGKEKKKRGRERLLLRKNYTRSDSRKEKRSFSEKARSSITRGVLTSGRYSKAGVSRIPSKREGEIFTNEGRTQFSTTITKRGRSSWKKERLTGGKNKGAI